MYVVYINLLYFCRFFCLLTIKIFFPKKNNLEILSLWILPIVTTLVKYKINVCQLTMIVVCRSKCICLLSHRLIVANTGTRPFPIPFPMHI